MFYSFDSNNLGNIPNQMSNLKRWILWKAIDDSYANFLYEESLRAFCDFTFPLKKRIVEGRIGTKKPISPITKKVFRRSLDECCHLDEIHKIYETIGDKTSWGIGFSSHGNEDILVLDFDRCLDKNRKIISKNLENFIYKLDNYTEISPSYIGLRVFLYFKTIKKINRSFSIESKIGKDICEKYSCKGIELWNKDKFATVTGNLYDKNLNKIKNNNLIIDEFILDSEKLTRKKIHVRD